MWWFAVAAVGFGWVIWSQVSLKAFQPDEARQKAPLPVAEAAPAPHLTQTLWETAAVAAAAPAQLQASAPPPAEPSRFVTPPGAAGTVPAPPLPQTPWETAVVAESPPAQPHAPTPPSAEPSRFVTPPAVHIAPGHLAEALQIELKRLGCYEGLIDNIWGRGSRRAMRRFIHTANLRFDAAKPDAKVVVISLRGYGDSDDCSAVAAPATSGQPGNPAVSANAADDRSYLPPWMRNDPRPIETAVMVSHAVQSPKRHRRRYRRTHEVRFKPVRMENRHAWTVSNKPVRKAGVKPVKRRKKAVAGVVIRKFTSSLQGWPGN